MIYAIAGRPGGGKTFESVAYHILPALKEGRKVVTNVTLNIEHFVSVLGEQVRDLIVVVDGELDDFGSMDRPFSKIKDYKDEWRNEKGQGPLFVIDEAHMSLPNRQLPADILEWYSLHRHYGVDIVLMTQNLRKIHRDIKDMIEITYLCTKNTAFGSSNSYTRKVKDGWNGDVVNTGFRKYETAYFAFYKSHSQSSKAVLEAAAKDIVPFWKRWPVIGSGIFLIVGIALTVFAWTPSDKASPQEPEDTTQTAPKVIDKKLNDGEPKHDDVQHTANFGYLDDFDLFVTGYAKQIAYSSAQKTTGEFNRDLTFFRIYIDVYRKKTKLFSTDNIELVQMGYVVNALAECVYQVSFGESSRIVVCRDNEENLDIRARNELIPSVDI